MAAGVEPDRQTPSDIMKSCGYCGAKYPDEASVCAVDGQSLDSWTEPQVAASKPRPGRFLCPACGAADDYRPAIELRGSFSWGVFFAGGLLAICFRNAGRSRKVRCNKCETTFNVRTPLSQISQVIFYLLICPAIITLIAFLIYLLSVFTRSS